MNASLTSADTTVKQAKLLINGEWVESKTTEWQDIVNPATQQVLARVPFATADEVNAAIDAAQRAFQTWKLTPIGARMRIMLKLQALIREHSKRIAAVLSAEQGKTIADAEGDIFRGLEVVEHACSIGTLQMGEFAENVAGGVDTYTLRQPIGVCAGITPFNFPAMIPLWMFPMAIACGNTFVLKPSEQDPLSTAPASLGKPPVQAGIEPSALPAFSPPSGVNVVPNRAASSGETAAIAKGPVDFAHGGIATQFGQQVTDGLAQTQVAGFNPALVALTARRCVDQGDIDRGARLRHRFTAGFPQQHRPTVGGRYLARRFKRRQAAQATRHHQCLVAGLPEQQAEGLLTRADGSQQVLLGGKACFNGHRYGLSHATPTSRNKHKTKCGSWLACDSGLPVNALATDTFAIAGKPAPTQASSQSEPLLDQSSVEPLTGRPRSGKNRRCNSAPGFSARIKVSPTRNE